MTRGLKETDAEFPPRRNCSVVTSSGFMSWKPTTVNNENQLYIYSVDLCIFQDFLLFWVVVQIYFYSALLLSEADISCLIYFWFLVFFK